MPNIRSLLLIALAFVGYLLWQAWEQDYAQRPQVADTLAASGTDASTPGVAASSDAPSAADTPSSADLPAAPPLASEAVAAVPAETSARVRVRTDVLDVTIDTRGGTFVHGALNAYLVSPKNVDDKVDLFSDDAASFYVAQSGLVATAGGAAPDHRALYTAEQTEYVLGEGQQELVVPLTWRDPSGITVTKRFVFKSGDYTIGVQHDIANASSASWSGSIYRQLQRTSPIVNRKFSFTNPEQYSFVGAAWYSPEERFEKLKFEDFAEEPLDRPIVGGWSAMLQHYFFSAWIPPEAEANTYTTAIVNEGGVPRYLVRQVATPVSVATGSQVTLESRLYVGPKLQKALPKIAPGLGSVIDYGKVTFLSEPLFWLLSWLHELLGNWGFAIIAVTVLIKAAFFKLSEAQYRSMAKMRKLQPRLAALKERYGDDRQKMNQAMMELYQKEKINPFGGCLPILVQIPVFIALYWVLIESVELRHAPFVLWIQNLSDRDPYFILPVLNAAAMFATQKLTPTPGMDPTQAKVMQLMPLIFGVMFAFFPAGLVLYWTVNGLLGLAQQWIIMKRVGAA
jgi:YidC/Oxa1 family membrane protein insertase